jgi:lipid-binding SYLF domain-containing protein
MSVAAPTYSSHDMKMKKHLFNVFLGLGLTLFALSGPSVLAKEEVAKGRAEIREMRDEVLEELFKLEPKLKSRLKKAEGYAVFSNVGVNLIIASFAGGHGIVVENGFINNRETFMKMGSAGIGLGLGIKDFRVVFVFTTHQALKGFIEKGWEFNGQAEATAKSDRKGGAVDATGSLMPGVEIYQLTKNGIALQATVQGTKYWRDKELN